MSAPLLGEAVKAARVERGLTLEQLGDKVEMTKSALSAIERGRSLPSVRTLERIATGLDMNLIILFSDAEPREVLDWIDHLGGKR